jgi:hypothetical protein
MAQGLLLGGDLDAEDGALHSTRPNHSLSFVASLLYLATILEA